MSFIPTPFLFGIQGTRATRESVRLLRETGALGVLLLGRNIQSPAQTRRLIEELQDQAGRPLVFAVDHEGGWVLRFSSGLTAFPGNAALGKNRDPHLAYNVGRQMARELRSIGIGLNLAPVLDVASAHYNPGIIIRSFGRDPGLVSALGAAFVRGLQRHGVGATAKHFPGKGAARQDAHISLPTIPLSKAQMMKNHLAPFQAAIKAGACCVMTSHVVFPALDPSRIPATFSQRILNGVLRKTLGFDGVIICDDLCMGAITRHWPVQEAAIKALKAGHDLLIIAHAPSAQYEAAEAVQRAQALIPESQRRASQTRLLQLLKRYARPASGPLPKPDASLAEKIALRALEVLQNGGVELPLKLDNGGRIAVLWPNLREVQDRFTFEGGPEEPLKKLMRGLSHWPARPIFARTPIELQGKEFIKMSRKVLETARRADITIFFCFEALRFPGQRKMLEILQKDIPQRLIVCLLRNPWDHKLLRPKVTALHAYGYRDCQISAILQALYPS